MWQHAKKKKKKDKRQHKTVSIQLQNTHKLPKTHGNSLQQAIWKLTWKLISYMQNKACLSKTYLCGEHINSHSDMLPSSTLRN